MEKFLITLGLITDVCVHAGVRSVGVDAMSSATKSKLDYRQKRTRIRKGLEEPKEYTMSVYQALKAAGLR